MLRVPKAAALVAAAFAVSWPLVTMAAAQEDVPTVSVVPADVDEGGPNGGRWFVEELLPGSSTTSAAVLTNGADVAQTVTLSVRDVDFTDGGAPTFADEEDGVSSWVRLDRSSVTIPSGQEVRVGFTVQVSASAEPGDHVGALVVASTPTEGQFQVTKQVATRLYVTVPGEARREFDLRSVERKPSGVLFPERLDVDVVLENTGRIRLSPAVTVDGRKATGSDVLLAQSAERYEGSADIPWYGGRVDATVRIDAGGGLVREDKATVFVVPWALIAIVLVILLVLAFLWVLWRTRRRRQREERERLEAEVRRLREQVGETA